MAPNIVDSFNDDYGLWAAEDFFRQTEAGAGKIQIPLFLLIITLYFYFTIFLRWGTKSNSFESNSK